MMYTATVQFAVGLDFIAWVVLRHFSDGEAISKDALWEKVSDRLQWFGPLGDDAWDDLATEEQTARAYAMAGRYFPELVDEKGR